LEGVGRAVALRGLSLEAALSLMERELERPLTPEEHHAARELYQRLAGHPLRIVQAAARARDEGLPLDKLPLPEPDAAPALTAWATGVAQLPDAQRQILTLLAALGGAALPVEHLTGALTQTGNGSGGRGKGPAASVSPLDVLAAFATTRPGAIPQPRYSVPAELLPLLPKLWPSDVAAWESALLRHFADWAETPERTPERVLCGVGSHRRDIADRRGVAPCGMMYFGWPRAIEATWRGPSSGVRGARRWMRPYKPRALWATGPPKPGRCTNSARAPAAWQRRRRANG
jgi:hypothetical protein